MSDIDIKQFPKKIILEDPVIALVRKYLWYKNQVLTQTKDVELQDLQDKLDKSEGYQDRTLDELFMYYEYYIQKDLPSLASDFRAQINHRIRNEIVHLQHTILKYEEDEE